MLEEYALIRHYREELNKIKLGSPVLFEEELPSESDVDSPFELAVVGRMKAGKSTLINSLLGEDIVISDVEEATATVNKISWCESERETFHVYYKSGVVDELPLSEREKWNGKSESVRQLVEETNYLQFHKAHGRLKGMNIIDTPGTSSTDSGHETVATSYLKDNKSRPDAILYVVPPVARESDEEAIINFGKSRASGLGAYNTVCILHKWDGLSASPFEEAQEKAKRLYAHLEGSVAAVIPVSGPLALLARTLDSATARSFVMIVHAISDDDLDKALSMDRRWDRDIDRRELRVRLKDLLSWVSFKLAVRVARCVDSGKQFLEKLEERSGIRELERFIVTRFVGKESVIRALGEMEQLESQNRSMQNALELCNEDLSSAGTKAWAASLRRFNNESIKSLTFLSRRGRRLKQLYWKRSFIDFCDDELSTLENKELYKQALVSGDSMSENEYLELASHAQGMSNISASRELREMFASLSELFTSKV